jgi:hypothetical protein
LQQKIASRPWATGSVSSDWSSCADGFL